MNKIITYEICVKSKIFILMYLCLGIFCLSLGMVLRGEYDKDHTQKAICERNGGHWELDHFTMDQMHKKNKDNFSYAILGKVYGCFQYDTIQEARTK